MASQLTQQLTKHIDEGVAMEQAVLRTLDSMLKATDDPELEKALEQHKRTTRRHAERLQERLRAHGARPSVRRRAGGAVTARAKSVIDLARREKPARAARDGFSTEQMEVAAYELLERIARRAGDEETAEVARQNRAEDEAMAGLIARSWDTFAQASVAEKGGGGGQSGGLTQRAKSAAGLLRNPVVIGLGSVAGGLAVGRRLQGGGAQGEERSNGAHLEQLSKQELQARATAAGIPVKRSMTKQELIDALASRGREATRRANPIEVQKFLEGVGYPASRDTLLREAERQGADERVRASLSRLPRRKFGSPAEVSESLGGSTG